MDEVGWAKSFHVCDVKEEWGGQRGCQTGLYGPSSHTTSLALMDDPGLWLVVHRERVTESSFSFI